MAKSMRFRERIAKDRKKHKKRDVFGAGLIGSTFVVKSKGQPKSKVLPLNT